MLPAPIPDNDDERLSALHALLILDTPPEQRFDRIVEFAAQEFDVPIALISLLDRDRQWFKSRFGLTVCETSRDISFCGHALTGDDILVVPDARVDERFVDNPLVTGDPFIRFYAGAPLIMPSGYVMGTLCLIDRRTRTLDNVERSIMSTLRDLVVRELIALDFCGRKYAQYDLSAIDKIRASDQRCRDMSVAVLVEHCTAHLLQKLRQRDVTRVILKPFRARHLLDTFAEFRSLQPTVGSGGS